MREARLTGGSAIQSLFMTRRWCVVPCLFLGLFAASVVTLTPVAAQQARQQKTGRALTKEDLTNAMPGRDYDPACREH